MIWWSMRWNAVNCAGAVVLVACALGLGAANQPRTIAAQQSASVFERMASR